MRFDSERAVQYAMVVLKGREARREAKKQAREFIHRCGAIHETSRVERIALVVDFFLHLDPLAHAQFRMQIVRHECVVCSVYLCIVYLCS